MQKIKDILIGAIVGSAAYFVYVASLGFIVGYLPINYQTISFGLSKENAFIMLKLAVVLETFLATFPMAILVYIFLRVAKLETTILFVITALTALLFCQIYFTGWPINSFTNIYFIVNTLLVYVVLWISMLLANKSV